MAQKAITWLVSRYMQGFHKLCDLATAAFDSEFLDPDTYLSDFPDCPSVFRFRCHPSRLPICMDTGTIEKRDRGMK